MRRLVRAFVFALVFLSLASPLPASAQSYSFTLPQESVDVYWETDGTARIEYVWVFVNDSSGPTIEFVDVGVPTRSYSMSAVSASVDGQAITDIQSSPYIDGGIALGLGSGSIPSGGRGTVRVSIPGVGGILYEADEPGYASAVFAPSFFDSSLVHGTTDLTVTYHFPPGLQPDEPRYYSSPSGWPETQPLAAYDASNRIIYQWHNPQANGSTEYRFGAAFPTSYLPSGVLQSAPVLPSLQINTDALAPCLCLGLFGALVVAWVVVAANAGNRRKLAYLPPRISIEGHGIKRGLTAVEAAVLLQTPLDRILTMILFGLVKKNAARVVTEQPLKVEAITPAPEGLHDYEVAFLPAIVMPESRERQVEMQKVTVGLVKAVQEKMKGFSLRETRDYYRGIIEKAWTEVEQAGTPEVKSKQFDDSLEWTMLDRDFEGRTRRTFSSGPVFVPIWWGNYRPSYSGPRVGAPSVGRAGPSTAGGGVSLPHLPGSDFAASLVRGVQTTAGGLVGNLASFTGGVTTKTNPPPPPPKISSSHGGWGGGGGHSCACACACAGCACACAGGGR
jgi:hypothetical protein